MQKQDHSAVYPMEKEYPSELDASTREKGKQ